MDRILKLISFLGLALTIGPAFLVFAGMIAWDTHAAAMSVGTALWFISAPFWMRDRTDEPSP